MISGLLILCSAAKAQAKDGAAELKMTVAAKQAASINLPYSPEVVTRALSDFILKKSESDQKKSKGYLLSSNTQLVKNNPGMDMHFVIASVGLQYNEQSVMYLKLNPSSSENDDSRTAPVPFTLEEAKEYLNNLAIAIKPYARNLQITLQTKNLTDAQNKKVSLVNKGDRLEQYRKHLRYKLENTRSERTIARLNKQALNNKNQIDRNQLKQVNQDLEIVQQKSSLALVVNPVL